MNELQTLAERLKWARTQNGQKVSQKELAEKSGMTQATINKLESGVYKSTSKIVAIAKALNVSVHWLDTGKGKPESSIENMTQLTRLEDTVRKLGLNDEEIKRVEKAALDEAMKIILEK
ncbi:Helix-turn-helix protein [Vibrio chagasii]|uniref:HTH cro/C1-type domain-containing protein n=1 Tax=Vibrio cyclitrophicus TaxID=47951 RepID=A0A7Z1MMI2_9VIBR|nr:MULTISPECIES: helix-turn-helix transcriptional regulator [Vibrio]CAH6841173.1 Helix-turn-helix protein [Vibrio chagasii]PME16820.1 hypothetical protein BCV44_13540 [Vibrio cyclitrophicus]PMP14450.1 hypothetical protein BCS91_11340 [Vibrio cyclitrophicus]PMP32976.1 hypothetical protein BCS90_09580 [Vibrio cyclitrophicus]TKF71114.1 helix-turn-helix transcriptional regulator [Vibrio sp. F13]